MKLKQQNYTNFFFKNKLAKIKFFSILSFYLNKNKQKTKNSLNFFFYNTKKVPLISHARIFNDWKKKNPSFIKTFSNYNYDTDNKKTHIRIFFENIGINRLFFKKKKITHPFYIAQYNEYPLIIGFFIFELTKGTVNYFHEGFLGIKTELVSFIFFGSIIYWMSDLLTMGKNFLVFTKIVKKNLKMGIFLFIVSEVMIFFGLFWAYFHSSLSPSEELGGIWPPAQLQVLEWWKWPTLSTALLVYSGVCVNSFYYTLRSFNVRSILGGRSHLLFVKSTKINETNELEKFFNNKLDTIMFQEGLVYPRVFSGPLHEHAEVAQTFYEKNNSKDPKTLNEDIKTPADVFPLMSGKLYGVLLKNFKQIESFNSSYILITLKNIFKQYYSLFDFSFITHNMPEKYKKRYGQALKKNITLSDLTFKEKSRCKIYFNDKKIYFPHPYFNTIYVNHWMSFSSVLWTFYGFVFIEWKLFTLYGGLIYTIFAGTLFLLCQNHEYSHAVFAMSDGVYGSVFYGLTGLHGLHVLVGLLLLISIFLRFINSEFTFDNNPYIGVTATVWYWHFVDIVWIFLYLIVYIWGNAKENFLV